MPSPIKHIDAMSLFVDDLQVAKAFYQRVFEVPVVFEDLNSAVLKFDNLLINLLKVENAQELVEPGAVGTAASGSRFQLSIWVPDVDAVCARLKSLGVTLLTGPRDRPWGLRTANFVDPSGHSWEVGQQLAAT